MRGLDVLRGDYIPPFQGWTCFVFYPGRCPGLVYVALSGLLVEAPTGLSERWRQRVAQRGWML